MVKDLRTFFHPRDHTQACQRGPGSCAIGHTRPVALPVAQLGPKRSRWLQKSPKPSRNVPDGARGSQEGRTGSKGGRNGFGVQKGSGMKLPEIRGKLAIPNGFRRAR